MLTLSQATADTRKILKYLAIFIGAVLSIIIVVRGIFALKEIISPTPPPPPTVSFGRLPKIAFPQSVTEKRLKYSINTISGSLPIFSDRATVNQMTGYSPNVLDVDNANRKAEAVGFFQNGLKLSDINYRWNDSSPLQRELNMNIVTSDFVLSSLFLQNPEVLSARFVGNEFESTNTASSFLKTMGTFPNDIDESKTKTVKYLVSNGSLMPATSLSNTQVIGVYFYQKDVNGLPIYYPNGGVSEIFMLVASGKYQPEVVGGDFSHQGISEASATYPIKTAQESFNNLKEGKGYIARYDVKSNDIQIKNVFLGYFRGVEKQEYLMPIVVFEGEGFYAYVSAVKDEWLDN